MLGHESLWSTGIPERSVGEDSAVNRILLFDISLHMMFLAFLQFLAMLCDSQPPLYNCAISLLATYGKVDPKALPLF